MTEIRKSLEGRIALVTGSARGLGAGMVRALATQGAAVAIHYRKSREAAERLAKELQDQGVTAATFQANVTRWAEVCDLRTAVLEHFGRLDILVNNVGTFFEKPWGSFTPAEWEEMLASNLTSVYYTCQAFWPGLVAQRWGRIINIGLANSDRIHAYRNILPYAIAKSGVLILSKSLALEGAPHQITVNVLAPGLMDNGTLDTTARQTATQQVPAGRPGTSTDLAAALTFLCSEAASYITGAQIPVSGGWGL
ncbi:MAG TPA: SDR family oxidoreductase [bacterium]|nr:SDR family oxidoreductase [bacterium]HQG44349.1 SDR family oxidoreductase [bacterium]HQI49082.1 SDR family oxidoreductase [bacterium]HQJ63283.1 SDR family oxidoreductase [bacterium]